MIQVCAQGTRPLQPLPHERQVSVSSLPMLVHPPAAELNSRSAGPRLARKRSSCEKHSQSGPCHTSSHCLPPDQDKKPWIPWSNRIQR